MSRTSFVDQDGQQIAIYDFTEIRSDKEALEVIEDAWGFLAEMDPKSVLTLTNVTGSTATVAVGRALYKLARQNRPFVKAAAIVGADDTTKMLAGLVTGSARRQFAMFDDVEEAKAWLVEQSRVD